MGKKKEGKKKLKERDDMKRRKGKKGMV